MESHTIFDWSRQARTGIPEVVFAQSKSAQQIEDILLAHIERAMPVLMTRLTSEQMDRLSVLNDQHLAINHEAKIASYRAPHPEDTSPEIAIVAAGTSDLPIALEASISANFLGLRTQLIVDVGVAGLWRLEQHLPELTKAKVIIAVAGMEGALFPVLAGLVPGAVIAVPSSVGYGVSAGGHLALNSALASCAPGVLATNIDNGFGAAAAAAKILL